MGNYKLITGYTGALNDWYYEDGTSLADSTFAYTGADDQYLFDLSSKYISSLYIMII